MAFQILKITHEMMKFFKKYLILSKHFSNILINVKKLKNAQNCNFRNSNPLGKYDLKKNSSYNHLIKYIKYTGEFFLVIAPNIETLLSIDICKKNTLFLLIISKFIKNFVQYF
jgi:hypothetical protein